MKKLVIVLISLIVIAGSVGAILYVKSLPPKPVYYGFKDSFTSDIMESGKHVVYAPFLKLKGNGHEKYLDENQKLISNVILFTIREKTEDELSTNEMIKDLCNEIMARLSEQMDVSFVEDIFFEQFYIA